MYLEILYQDQDYVAVSKPAGLLVHRTSVASEESLAALQILRDQINEKVFPVHRLDRPTSGVLIFAKSSEAAQKLADEFLERRVQKKYLAVVRGKFKNEINLDYPLAKEIEDEDKLQDAQTFFKPIATVELNEKVERYSTSRYSLVEAIPLTGRTHQIRRHLKHLSHPIIGDVNHGNGKHNRFFQEKFNCKRLLLACTEISFQHPATKQTVLVRASLAEDFCDTIKKLGWGQFATT